MTNQFNENIKTIYAIYALIGAGSIMMLIPYMMLPYAGVSCAFVGLMAAYFYRWRYKADDITAQQTSYIIRTVWISSLILTIGIIVFGCIIFFNGDMTAVNALMANAQNGVVPNESDIALMQHAFVQTNRTLIIMAAVISLVPYPLYLIYRTFKGVQSVKNTMN